MFDRLVYRKLQAVFGGRMRFAFSGGGPLGERLTHFFNGIGVRIFEGYGLTETSPTLTVNRADAWKPGTVGTAAGGHLDPHRGRRRDPRQGPAGVRRVLAQRGGHRRDLRPTTAGSVTGDIGELDDDGFLRITGRKKELIVTAAGKNVAPERRSRTGSVPIRSISQAVVVGDARPFIAALVTLDEEAVQRVGRRARTR